MLNNAWEQFAAWCFFLPGIAIVHTHKPLIDLLLNTKHYYIERIEGRYGYWAEAQPKRLVSSRRSCAYFVWDRSNPCFWKDLGHHPKRLAFQVELPKSLYVKPSPCITDVRLFVRLPTQQSPLEHPYKHIFLHTQKTICSMEITNLYRAGQTRLTWSINCNVTHHCQVLESPTSFLQGPTAPFVPIWRVEHHPHTRLSLRHGSDTMFRSINP